MCCPLSPFRTQVTCKSPNCRIVQSCKSISNRCYETSLSAKIPILCWQNVHPLFGRTCYRSTQHTPFLTMAICHQMDPIAKVVKCLYMFVINMGVAILCKYGVGGTLWCKVIVHIPRFALLSLFDSSLVKYHCLITLIMVSRILELSLVLLDEMAHVNWRSTGVRRSDVRSSGQPHHILSQEKQEKMKTVCCVNVKLYNSTSNFRISFDSSSLVMKFSILPHHISGLALLQTSWTRLFIMQWLNEMHTLHP
jgi:hypothetical protein